MITAAALLHSKLIICETRERKTSTATKFDLRAFHIWIVGREKSSVKEYELVYKQVTADPSHADASHLLGLTHTLFVSMRPNVFGITFK